MHTHQLHHIEWRLWVIQNTDRYLRVFSDILDQKRDSFAVAADYDVSYHYILKSVFREVNLSILHVVWKTVVFCIVEHYFVKQRVFFE